MLTSLILKASVPGYGKALTSDIRTRCGIVSGITGIVCNLILIVVKLILAVASGSIAIAAEAVISLLNIEANYVLDEAETEAVRQPLYAGEISPARVLAACDYLAMDLRAMSAVGVTTLFPDIQFPYVRYSLRLLMSRRDRDAVEQALERGYERVFEMEPPPLSEVTDGEGEES